MANKSDVTTVFEDTILNSDLSSVMANMSESIIDSMTNLPIVSLIRTTGDIRDYLFLKKILSFLNGIKDIKSSTRKRMIAKIEKSEDYRHKVGEKLLYIIDRCDDNEKVSYIATAFCAFLKKKIKYGQFLICADMIQKTYIDVLKYFLDETEDWLMVEDAQEELAAGLFYLDMTTTLWNCRKFIMDEIDENEIGDPGARISDVGRTLRYIFNPYYEGYHNMDMPDPMLNMLLNRPNH